MPKPFKLAEMMKHEIAGCDLRRAEFWCEGRRVLKYLAKELSLTDYKIKVIKGGIAVSGEVMLETNTFQLYVGQFMFDGDQVMYRSYHDKKYGNNCWTTVECLLDISAFAKRLIDGGMI